VNEITTVGIDLAKQVVSVHGVDGRGQVILRGTIRREKLAEQLAQWPSCRIGMEACFGAHQWARQFQALGYEVKLMAPKFVIPYRKSGKNDGNDAEAICEAVGRPTMRFVPVKSVEQQSILTLHRVRQGFVAERTATINRIRGLLAEFGIVLPQRAVELRRRLAGAIEALPPLVARALSDLRAHTAVLDERIGEYERELGALARHDNRLSRWALSIRERRGYHRACVAIAAKNARIAWALLARDVPLNLAA
jgi:transposase